MAMELAARRLDSLLTTSEARVLLLVGGWGAGKTYQYRQALRRQGQYRQKIRHAYVSLFGITSLAELRRRIVEESVATLTVPGTSKSVGEAVVEEGWKLRPTQLLRLLPILPWVQKLESVAHDLSFLAVKDSVVCFDDIERRGKGLELKDLLGLASQLREERNCRVVLISNESKLAEPDAQALRIFSEKVVDETVRVEPTVAEACAIALRDLPPSAVEKLVSKFSSLEVTNIRVIDRIGRLAGQMLSLDKCGTDDVQGELLHSLAILGSSFFAPADALPSFEFLMARKEGSTDWLGFGPKKGRDEMTAEERRNSDWEKVLREYGYAITTPLDEEIGRSVQRGYFDRQAFCPLLAEFEAQANARALAMRFQSEWQTFFHSLDGDSNALLDRLQSITMECATAIGPNDISVAYKAFEDLGKADVAERLLSFYVDANVGRPRLFDLSSNPFPVHRAIRDRFQMEHQARALPVSIDEALDRIKPEEGFNTRDVETVARLASPAEIDRLLRGISGRLFNSRLRTLLRLGTLTQSGVGAHVAEMTRKYVEMRVAEDPVVRVRVASYFDGRDA